MFPVTIAIPASIPLPVDLAPGLAPVVVMVVILLLGAAEILRAVLAERRTAAAVSQPRHLDVVQRSGRSRSRGPKDHPLAA